ncbi:hypothetical protein TPHA_0B01950 [Tetrapisispora phaffii CBS 4417]|uniref:Vacuolar protein-sorting-associated protein 36 n=1 Tax=Tetrapisispora phaffii (strain ATCC 24235 / CBS 4417 / NBRC 1672 / NRRL Y-8282 / UCD 70-5) TaxID=1071381 RepID=G8BPD6_TETPH|nr:hypothetical protein TPHA_0B01950 [Tetrapisispora phaffii CBS 4417]CCE61867.1 hypothetical protein TPHA_0B01950 [Tetrapisispora phaffii CBS 4417]
MECWHYVEVTKSGQPILRENEKDILIEDKIGLYHGKNRIKNRQSGRLFLTTQRLIYVDDVNPVKYSVCLELDDIDHLEYSSRFLKRSAKVILFLLDMGNLKSGGQSTSKAEGPINEVSTWVCPICMFTNETEGVLTENTFPSPICENCGVPLVYEMTMNTINIIDNKLGNSDSNLEGSGEKNLNACPACTFINHALIKNCEICGARLPNAKIRSHNVNHEDSRVLIELDCKLLRDKSNKNSNLEADFVQFSFRKGDGLLFSQALEKSLEDIKNLRQKNSFNEGIVSINGISIGIKETVELPYLEKRLNKFGITSLENSRETQLANNDILLSNALTDLNQLMSLANDIEKVFKTHMKNETDNLQNKPSFLIDREKFYNKSMFLNEIAREIFQFVITEFKSEKNDDIIMVTLVDLYALYNKTMRIGMGYISPSEMREACGRFEVLGLTSLKLKKLNGRVLCLSSENSFDYINNQIIKLLEDEPGCDILQITQTMNKHSTGTSWTIGIITEVLENCINKGEIVIDEQLSGLTYYKNDIWI